MVAYHTERCVVISPEVSPPAIKKSRNIYSNHGVLPQTHAVKKDLSIVGEEFARKRMHTESGFGIRLLQCMPSFMPAFSQLLSALRQIPIVRQPTLHVPSVSLQPTRFGAYTV